MIVRLRETKSVRGLIAGIVLLLTAHQSEW